LQIHLKTLLVGLIVAIGAWCLLWNPIEYLDKELGTYGLTVLGICIFIFAWAFWRRRVI